MSTIATEAELRAVIGPEPPGLAEKNQPALDDFAVEFIAKSPCPRALDGGCRGAHRRLPQRRRARLRACGERTRRHSLVIPDRLGNRLAYGHRNILANPRVGVLFMIPGTPETLRVNGRAELSAEPELLGKLAALGRAAVLAIHVQIEEVFFHCAKAFLRSQLWKPETWQARHEVSFGKMYAAKKKAAASHGHGDRCRHRRRLSGQFVDALLSAMDLPPSMSRDALKRDAAEAALRLIGPMLAPESVVGVGTGSTANFFIDGLARDWGSLCRRRLEQRGQCRTA